MTVCIGTEALLGPSSVTDKGQVCSLSDWVGVGIGEGGVREWGFKWNRG